MSSSIHALADQRQLLIQGRIKTRLDVCQDVLGVGESVPRKLDGVDNPQRNQVEDLPFEIEREIGRHLHRRIAIDAQQPENLPLRILVVNNLGVRNWARF